MLTPDQRRWRADKIGALANYTIGALLIGQLINNQCRPLHTVVGIAVVIGGFFYSNRLLKHLH